MTAPQQGSAKSWQGRLTADTDELTARFVASIDVDYALASYDVAGSIAHARMLAKIGVLTRDEFEKIRAGLQSVLADIQAGKLDMPLSLEDIHMVVEKALTDRIGPVGGKLHTGRSRNDQVALDLRLWARDAAERLIESIRQLQRSLVGFARQAGDAVMPAYTHLQRAQPILAAQAVLAYVEMLDRDAGRLADARRRLNVCPLGSGAVAGTSIPLDRDMTAAELGFDSITRNSIDATSDRDFLAELCFCCAMLGVHLSRWAEDWIIYATTEFGFINLADAYCTSSSMMPQKKNPDTLELVRGKSATVIASLVGMLTLLKGLPLAYNRDLQDDKRLAMPAVDAMMQALAVAAGVAASSKLNTDRIGQRLDEGFLDATALAEYLVNRGLPFRQAHHVVGRLVGLAESQGKSLGQLPLETLRESSELFEQGVYDCLGPANVVRNYRPAGSAGPSQVASQLKYWNKTLEK